MQTHEYDQNLNKIKLAPQSAAAAQETKANEREHCCNNPTASVHGDTNVIQRLTELSSSGGTLHAPLVKSVQFVYDD